MIRSFYPTPTTEARARTPDADLAARVWTAWHTHETFEQAVGDCVAGGATPAEAREVWDAVGRSRAAAEAIEYHDYDAPQYKAAVSAAVDSRLPFSATDWYQGVLSRTGARSYTELKS